MLNYSGAIVNDAAVRGPHLVINSLFSFTTDTADITHDCNLHRVLRSHVTISNMDSHLTQTNDIRSRKSAPIDYATLANRWMISPAKAKQTVQRTTQRGYGPVSTRRSHAVIRPMTVCSAISGCHIRPSLTLCLPGPRASKATSVPRSTPHPLDGVELIL
jgi:hypothetical protein